MADNPQIKLNYLKDKYPTVKALRFAPKPNGVTMYLDLLTHSREEFFSGLDENQLRNLVRPLWPEAFKTDSGEAEWQLFINGKLVPVTGIADLDDAHEIVRQLEIDRDEMVTVKDADGQIKARYVSNRNGEIRRLED